MVSVIWMRMLLVGDLSVTGLAGTFYSHILLPRLVALAGGKSPTSRSTHAPIHTLTYSIFTSSFIRIMRLVFADNELSPICRTFPMGKSYNLVTPRLNIAKLGSVSDTRSYRQLSVYSDLSHFDFYTPSKITNP